MIRRTTRALALMLATLAFSGQPVAAFDGERVICSHVTTGSDSAWAVNSTSWVDIPNASVTLPLDTNCIVWVNWMGNILLSAGPTVPNMSVRLVVDGTPEPFAEAELCPGTPLTQTQRQHVPIVVCRELSAGMHTITIQGKEDHLGDGTVWHRKLSAAAVQFYAWTPNAVSEQAGYGSTRCGSASLRCHPSPAKGSTNIRFQISRSGPAALRVFSGDGRLVRTVFSGQTHAGSYSLIWNGRDDSGRPVPAGAYYYRLSADGIEVTEPTAIVR